MSKMMDSPAAVFVFALIALWLAARVGLALGQRRKKMEDEERDDFDTIVAATLTLLGLIVGFTFSMAISRYDQRKNYEEAEANAIGTEYVRTDLMPAADGERVRELLRSYLRQRILYYETRDDGELQRVNATTSQIQNDLWSAVRGPAAAQPTAVSALTLAGMNDVLNSQGYTQASWWNRIPPSAWALMILIGVCCNLLIGYGAWKSGSHRFLFLVLPLVVAISFFLIADIDSPRGGVILVRPQNLDSLAQSLH
jgi:hypothetical protein